MTCFLPFSRRAMLGLALATGLAACAGGPFDRSDGDDAPAVPVAVTVMPDDDVTRPERRPGTSDEDSAVSPGDATAGSETTGAADGLLGETLAGLGSPSESGLWLRTGLVQNAQRGRVETEGGTSLTLELRPSGREPGSGSHLSLEAMQQLGLPLTQLATLRVSAGR